MTEKSLAEKRFDAAIQARSQELELFWKRSLFFWGFISSAFIGYAATSQSHPPAALTLSCFGFVCSLAWTLLNRGSKYWQENWEQKVASEEEGVVGVLFRRQERRQDKGAFSGFRFSVSRLAVALSDFTVLVWAALIAIQGWQAFGGNILDFDLGWYFLLVVILTVVYSIALVVGTLPDKGQRTVRSVSKAGQMTSDEKLVRWQAQRREHLSSANQLFLTYAAALLAFEVTILINRDILQIARAVWFLIAIAAAGVSFVVGCAVLLVRLSDTRLTARIVRQRARAGDTTAIADIRARAKARGTWTWRLLKAQVIGFAIATAALAAWVFLAFRAKLV